MPYDCAAGNQMRLPSPLRRAPISTRLAMTLTAILLLAAIAQSFLYFRTRDETLAEADDSYRSLAKAIEVAATQMGETGWKDDRVLADYRDKLARSGLRDIRITEAGKPFLETVPTAPYGARKRPHGPKEILIRGTVGDETGAARDLRIPLVVDGKYLGWIEIRYSLENIRDQLTDNFRRRLFALAGVWAFGLLLVLLVARGVSRPLGELSRAAARVAEGHLDASVTFHREDEIGRLADAFNQMTEKLRERQELEARLLAAEKRAEIGHLASGLAHEIKNPLNALSLGLDVLRRRHQPENEEGARAYTARIGTLREEIDRLSTLINNFLTYGRPLSLTRAPIDLAALVEATASDLAETAERVGVTIDTEVDRPFPSVDADGSLVKSAVWNLIQNAVQAMERTGGRLHVLVRRVDDNGLSRAEVAVEDEGPGVAEADLPQVFEPYFSRKDGGIGLGLAMVKRIAEEHGGSVGATNRPGAGASFRIILPLAVPAGGGTEGNLAA